MAAILTLPRLGETMEEGRVVGWLKAPGDTFRRGETIAEIETDKTVVELPALADGVLLEILAAVGAEIKVGAPLCRYEGEAVAPPAAAEAPQPTAATQAADPVAPDPVADNPVTTTTARVRATPPARRLARQNGIDIADVPGSGRRARIETDDVAAFVAKGEAPPADAAGVLFRDLPAGRMAYRTWHHAAAAPSSPPLLLLHGFGGDSLTWHMFATDLARHGRQIIAPDLPAHGATDFDAATLDGLADAVAGFIAALSLGTVELAGHSLGGAVAARLAQRLGNGVSRVTLIAPAGLGAEIDADFIDGMAHAAAGGGLAHLLRRIALRPPMLSTRQLDAMATTLGGRQGLKTLAAALVRNGRQQIDIVGDLAGLEGRARLVWGLEDRIIPWSQAVRAGSLIPVHFIPEAGHMPQWDQPRKLAALFS